MVRRKCQKKETERWWFEMLGGAKCGVSSLHNHSRRRLCKKNSRVLGQSGLELPDNLGCRVKPCLS